ncbi:conserved exported hypothetical protein [Candidatus Terasakiella magnetica]|uniref:Solute-binding protein family 3/N-terminal domain-containing protein n=1 Tax=Candidatus Terasakiella magnetica TaxID=1867952 RepID=A0A1C3RCX6_9PROT|nr:transporter substrate-binding domain-containing protein [Candidatus Terasakiella magnetica]SCA55137.1 conserved exported hypothetical protein [Candidatus Terasakiella magnetica]
MPVFFRSLFVISVFSLSVFFSSVALAGSALSLMTEEFAPYQFYEGEGEDKKLTGISIEIVKAIQNEIGNNDKIKAMPWNRALKLVKNKKNTALFSTARTPEREDKFKWVGPLASLEIVFFRKKGSDVTFSSVEEAKKVGKIGVTKNVATQEILSDLGFQNLDIMKSGADEKNLTRLLKGRIDVWPTAYYAGTYSAKKAGKRDMIEAVKGVNLLSGHLYIAFHKETDGKVINQWQAALDLLKAQGAIDKIIAKYDR